MITWAAAARNYQFLGERNGAELQRVVGVEEIFPLRVTGNPGEGALLTWCRCTFGRPLYCRCMKRHQLVEVLRGEGVAVNVLCALAAFFDE
jgi:hypothetical protein